MDVFAGAFLDVAQNLNLLSGNLSVVEIPDTTNPTIESVTIDFGYGTLLIQASETTLRVFIKLIQVLFLFQMYLAHETLSLLVQRYGVLTHAVETKNY